MEHIEHIFTVVDALSEMANQFYGWRLLQAVLAIRRSGFPAVQAAFVRGDFPPGIACNLLRLCEPHRPLEDVLRRIVDEVEEGWAREAYRCLCPFIPPAD